MEMKQQMSQSRTLQLKRSCGGVELHWYGLSPGETLQGWYWEIGAAVGAADHLVASGFAAKLEPDYADGELVDQLSDFMSQRDRRGADEQ